MDRVRAPNIRDVARLAGVSYQTVSRVLNAHPSIKESTRERVESAIAELGYRPNEAARTLVTSRSRTIGILAALTVHYGPATAIAGVETAAREAGYRVSITTPSSGDYGAIASSLDYLISQRVEAIVVVAPQARVFEAVQRLSLAVPIVTLESSTAGAARTLSLDQVAVTVSNGSIADRNRCRSSLSLLL